ncbi:MAG: helix-turn-helix domain-containing protein [Actinobacteria bacterium]|nr:helix-turn-helix domain-containing protein [Actinomycetota bacterium]MCL6104857.1 helix-turn-helix domain-containing protein [Actinomycetota bacterium]
MSDSWLQKQARALGDPTRYAIFRYIYNAAQPVNVAEITKVFGLNHNAIRQHLAKLQEAELVLYSRAVSTARGRPTLVYKIHPGVQGTWETDGPYERLSLMLLEMLKLGNSAYEVGLHAFKDVRVKAAPDDDILVAFQQEIAKQGFRPVLVKDRIKGGRGCEFVLAHCPFSNAAVVAPKIVCELHHGLAQGLAQSLGKTFGEPIRTITLTPTKADHPHCRLRIELG